MGCRRLISLMKGLEEGSALGRSVTKGWGYQEELLATIAEVVDHGNRNFLAANGVKRHELPRAIIIRRPNEPPKRKATKDELLEMFGRQAFKKLR